MGVLGLDLEEGLDTSLQRIRDPFERFFREPPDLKGAQERNDFSEGMEIVEFSAGRQLTRERIIFIGDMMPHVPFKFGGEQKIVKDYYPGNSEPTVQILGPREDDITINGRLKAKLLKAQGDRKETLRTFPEEMQELITAMRVRGNLVRITMGEFQRFGFIQKDEYDVKTRADIKYRITFSIIGFNPPSDCKILNTARTIPVDINKELIQSVINFQASRTAIPEGMPRSLADQLRDAINTVAENINLVTDFVDAVLTEVDDLGSAISRALGLIKNARSNISQFQRRIGAFDPLGQVGTSAGSGISVAYTNAAFIQSSLFSAFSLLGFLALLADQLRRIAETDPLARHRVQEGDTLQQLAIKFYDDSSQWKTIFDHNKLTDVELVNGAILEIPRVS